MAKSKIMRSITATIVAMATAICMTTATANASGTFDFYINTSGTSTSKTINAGTTAQNGVAYTTYVISTFNAKGVSYQVSVVDVSGTVGSGSLTSTGTFNRTNYNYQIKKDRTITVQMALQPNDSAFGSYASGTVYGG